MSLVPTFVLAIDGQFYEDPSFRGKDWFLCFDDDDPPELVMVLNGSHTMEDQHRRAQGILTHIGIPARINRGSYSCRGERLFGGKFKPAARFFIDIKEPIPIPTKHDGQRTWEYVMSHECVIYAFGKSAAQRAAR